MSKQTVENKDENKVQTLEIQGVKETMIETKERLEGERETIRKTIKQM